MAADVKSVIGKLLNTRNPTGKMIGGKNPTSKMLSGQKKKSTEDVTEEILEKD